MIDFLKEASAAFVGFGFIYFIVLRLCKYLNNKKRALVSFILGLILSIACVVGIVVDDIYPKITIDTLFYYAYLIVSVLMMIIIPVVYLVRAKSRNERFRNYHQKIIKDKEKQAVKTIKDKEEYVFYLFKYDDKILLKKRNINSHEMYYSETIKLDKILFHDEMINELLKKFNLSEDVISNYDMYGCALLKDKLDKHYYCYMIEINQINESFEDFEMVSVYDLFRYEMDDFNKKIIFHLILKEKFDIEI